MNPGTNPTYRSEWTPEQLQSHMQELTDHAMSDIWDDRLADIQRASAGTFVVGGNGDAVFPDGTRVQLDYGGVDVLPPPNLNAKRGTKKDSRTG